MDNLARKLNYLKETISLLIEKISVSTGEDIPDDLSLRMIITNRMDMYQSPWEYVESGTDAYGRFSCVNVADYNADEKVSPGGYWRLKTKTFKTIPASFYNVPNSNPSGSGYDLTSARNNFTSHLQMATNIYLKVMLPDHTARLILPERAYLNITVLRYPPTVTFLPKTGSMWSDWIWISNTTVGSANYVKCPKDSDMEYYLNKFNLSNTDMINIINNLKDRSTETDIKTITFGSTNLAKLTPNQQSVAYKKGWQLK